MSMIANLKQCCQSLTTKVIGIMFLHMSPKYVDKLLSKKMYSVKDHLKRHIAEGRINSEYVLPAKKRSNETIDQCVRRLVDESAKYQLVRVFFICPLRPIISLKSMATCH